MKGLVGLLVIGTMGLELAGCKVEASDPLVYKDQTLTDVVGNTSKYSGSPISIEGKPLSVASEYGNHDSWLSVIVSEKDKKLMAFGVYRIASDRILKAETAIQSEINDGDDERIKLRGVMGADGILKLDSIEANGYNITLINLK